MFFLLLGWCDGGISLYSKMVVFRSAEKNIMYWVDVAQWIMGLVKVIIKMGW